MGPVGLGFLLAGGYVDDARTFFCPSTGGDMPPARNIRGDSKITDHANAATGPRDLRAAGGFDHKAIAYGDWSALSPWGTGTAFSGLAVQSNYHYRNTPAAVPAYHTVLNIAFEDLAGLTGSTEGTTHPVRFIIGYTKPDVTTAVGCPAFKTQKLLGGRALVADTFAYTSWTSNCVDTAYGGDKAGGMNPYAIPGYGYYAHRDGYNVLYGDWSARWHGDPNRRIMYPRWSDYGGSDDGPYYGGCTNYIATYWNTRRSAAKHRRSGMHIWNVFDMSAGIDVHEAQPDVGNPP